MNIADEPTTADIVTCDDCCVVDAPAAPNDPDGGTKASTEAGAELVIT